MRSTMVPTAEFDAVGAHDQVAFVVAGHQAALDFVGAVVN